MRLGIVGYSAQKFNEDEARLILTKLIFEARDSMGCTCVVSGLTDLGIPGLAYSIARNAGLRTIGVACEKAREYTWFPVDEALIVGSYWGQESDAFLACCDMIARVGGGPQSMRECQTARESGKEVLEFELKAIS
jgi:hypothetical protein